MKLKILQNSCEKFVVPPVPGQKINKEKLKWNKNLNSQLEVHNVCKIRAKITRFYDMKRQMLYYLYKLLPQLNLFIF